MDSDLWLKESVSVETPPPSRLNKASRYTIFGITGKEVSLVAPCVDIIIIAFTGLDPCVKECLHVETPPPRPPSLSPL